MSADTTGTINLYPLKSGDAGAERLALLASVHERGTRALFARLDVPPRAMCLDVGCGAGAVTRLLASTFCRGGGRALGIDIDQRYIDVARDDAAADPSLDGIRVDFEATSASDIDFHGAYDLVYSRFLLTHLRERDQALAAMVRAAKPGAVIALEDVDFGGAFAYPPSPDFERYLAFYDAMTRQNGGDPNLGRALYGMLHRAGIRDIELRIDQPVFTSGPGKGLAPTTLEHIGDALVAKGVADADEVSRTLAGLRAYAAEPTTTLSMPRIFQAWGRVPA